MCLPRPCRQLAVDAAVPTMEIEIPMAMVMSVPAANLRVPASYLVALVPLAHLLPNGTTCVEGEDLALISCRCAVVRAAWRQQGKEVGRSGRPAALRLVRTREMRVSRESSRWDRTSHDHDVNSCSDTTQGGLASFLFSFVSSCVSLALLGYYMAWLVVFTLRCLTSYVCHV